METARPAQTRQLIGRLRVAVGVVAWLAPQRTARMFGIDPVANPSVGYVTRLFAARDAVLGAGVLDADDDAQARRWVRWGIAVDSADMLAALAAGLRGRISGRAALATAGAAAVGVALGVHASRE